MEDSLFLFLGGLGTSYTRENPPEEIDESGSEYWFLDSSSIYKSYDSLLSNEGDISFVSSDFGLLDKLVDMNMWSSVFEFSGDRLEAIERIGKPLQIMANNLIKKL